MLRTKFVDAVVKNWGYIVDHGFGENTPLGEEETLGDLLMRECLFKERDRAMFIQQLGTANFFVPLSALRVISTALHIPISVMIRHQTLFPDAKLEKIQNFPADGTWGHEK